MRKRWRVVLRTGLDGRAEHPFRGQNGAYDWLREYAHDPASTPFDKALVYVSNSSGWDLFEVLPWSDYHPEKR